MVNPYERKKQPEVVRRALLESAANIAIGQGLAAVTIQAVADAAGVTKGGLFHHFCSKHALVEGMFSDLLNKFAADIDARIERDPQEQGRFTRAYVDAMFDDDQWGLCNPSAALAISISAEPNLRAIWGEWMSGLLVRHQDTDHAPMLEIVRLAADGAWLTFCGQEVADSQAIHQRLVALTRVAN